MSRSGNHALANWILQQARGRTCFLNCAEPRTNPFLSARPLDDDGRVALASYQPFRLSDEQQGKLSGKDLLLFTHEDCFLGMFSNGEPFESRHDEWVGASRRRVDLLLLRDPFNLFASRISGSLRNGASVTAFRIWKQHAREFLGKRRHLRGDRVLVNYNRWVQDPAYRRNVAEALDLEFSDAGRLEVPAVGAGSSFDGCRFDGNAAAMPVLERWKWLQQRQDYLCNFDPDVVDLAERIFGDVCDPSFYHLLDPARN